MIFSFTRDAQLNLPSSPPSWPFWTFSAPCGRVLSAPYSRVSLAPCGRVSPPSVGQPFIKVHVHEVSCCCRTKHDECFQHNKIGMLGTPTNKKTKNLQLNKYYIPLFFSPQRLPIFSALANVWSSQQWGRDKEKRCRGINGCMKRRVGIRTYHLRLTFCSIKYLV